METSIITPLVIFIAVYGLIIVRNVRGFNFPIWATMTIGAVAVLLLQIIPPEQALQEINFEVIIFLVGMFAIVSGLESSGLLKYITIKILEYAKTPNRVLSFILMIVGIMSSFLINDTVALVATPIVIGLAKQMKIRSTPFLIALAFGVTIGSVMTPVGNPQNLLISLDSGIDYPFWTFLQYLIAPTLVCIVATYVILKRFYKKELDSAVMPQIHATKDMITDLALAKMSSIIMVAVVIGFLTVGFVKLFGITSQINFSYVALAGGLVLLAASRRRKEIISGINWSIIVFFVSMFVFMGAMWQSRTIELFASAFPPINVAEKTTSLLNIVLTSVGLSQLMSNVPFVAIYVQIMHNLGYGGNDAIFWMTLAGASTLAGNLTILGAASNVIILQAAEKRKEKAFSFVEFLKIGVIVTTTNIAILCTFLLAYLYLI